MKLTKRYIDSVGYQGTAGSRDVRWDALLPSFGIRIYPNGKKACVLSYRSAQDASVSSPWAVPAC
ncbi:MAG: hypothetical protein P8164_12705 [Gammaproteobacteria bacterium]|jgi:hypothetical protein